MAQGCPQPYGSPGPFYEITLSSIVNYQSGSVSPSRIISASILNGRPSDSNLTIAVNSSPLHWSDSNYTSNSILPNSDGSLHWDIVGDSAISLPALKITIFSPSTPQRILYPTDTTVIDPSGPIQVQWIPDSSSDLVFIQVRDKTGHGSFEYLAPNTGSYTLDHTTEDLSWMAAGPGSVRIWRYNQVDSNYVHRTSDANFWYLATATSETNANFILK